MSTKIEWCDVSWNPVTGCSPISAGCKNCYAARMAKRLRGRYGYPKDDPFRVTLHKDKLDEPLKWKKSRKVFVCSMGDLFHKDASWAWQYSILSTIGYCSQHTFMILTKRPADMKTCISKFNYTLRNLWLGVTAENQTTADKRIPVLLSIPAAVHFVSVEPMLEPVDLNKRELLCKTWSDGGLTIGTYLDWVIAGPETGPGARPCNPKWIEDLYHQCQKSSVPFFDKRKKNWLAREWPEKEAT